MSNHLALVCGAGGFIGAHLVRRLKAEGRKFRGVDLKPPPFAATITSTVSPATISMCTMAGVLSLVLVRLPAGSDNTEARRTLSGFM